MSTSSVVPFHGSYLMPTLGNARVADAMHPGVLVCDPDDTLVDVARLIATHHIHCLAVMGVGHERTGERLVWTVVSDVDVVRAGLAGGNPPISAIGSHPVMTIEPDTPLREAAEQMLARDITHALVVEPSRQRPVGVLSTLDIAGVIAWGDN